MRKLNLFVLSMILLIAVLTPLYFFTSSELMQTLILALIFSILVIILLYFVLHAFLPDRRLKKDIHKMITKDLSIDEQKKLYITIYEEYCKIPEKTKQKYFEQVQAIRQTIALHISNRNELENHIAESDKGNVKQKKKRLETMQEILNQLPNPDKAKYSYHLEHYSDKLERR